MTLPIVPVAVAAALTGLGAYVLSSSKDAPSGALGETTKPVPGPGPLPPAKRPNDLPPSVPSNVTPMPQPAPSPVPTPSNVLPIPIHPQPQPAPSPVPQPPLPLPVPTPVAPSSQTGLVIAPSGVNLRRTPDASTSSNVMYGMPAGTRVKILSYNPLPTSKAPKGWYNVTAPNGMTGWATAEFINPDNGSNPNPVHLPIPLPPVPNVVPVTPPPVPVSLQMQGLVGGSPGTNMRAAPNTSGAIIKGVYAGTLVTVLSPQLAPPTAGAPQGWVNVKDSTGATGWMSRQYVTPVGGASFGRDPFSNSGGLNYRKRSRIKG